MPTCTRCHGITCKGGCSGGMCKTCGSYSCRGNCSVPFKQTKFTQKPVGLLRCAVCGVVYTYLHSTLECHGNVERMKQRSKRK